MSANILANISANILAIILAYIIGYSGIVYCLGLLGPWGGGREGPKGPWGGGVGRSVSEGATPETDGPELQKPNRAKPADASKIVFIGDGLRR